MRPIVDGLQEQYGGRVSFVYLNAFDAGEGEAAFGALSLLGHPSYVIFTPEGVERFRKVGAVDESVLVEALEAVVSAPA
ncbi:MAG: hypothetical protein JNM70_21095 [Anaerolineae bacterium]|nr:hypothetical protein [Anaerolineae bacterium]